MSLVYALIVWKASKYEVMIQSAGEMLLWDLFDPLSDESHRVPVKSVAFLPFTVERLLYLFIDFQSRL